MTKRRITKQSSLMKFGTALAFVVFAIYSISLLFPFFWMLLNSFRSVGEWQSIVSFTDFWGFPKTWDFNNFLIIFQENNVLEMVFYSVILTVFGTIVNVFFSACAAYVLAKYEFPGRKLIYALAIFAMVVPIVGTLPAQVRFMEMLNLDDTVIGVLFLYSGAFGFNFILLYSAFSSISWSYAEAAQMDGGGHFTIFFKVMIPMCKGPIISCCILQAIALWNDYSTPYLFLNSHPTLAVGLQSLQEELIGQGGKYPLVFASMIISIIPVIVLYALFQKKIIENTVAGGLKG